jgi:hypothetical protein
MSVVRQDPDLQDSFNELEAKVLLLQEEHKKLRRKVSVLESLAKKHGVKIDNTDKVELDTCIIV